VIVAAHGIDAVRAGKKLRFPRRGEVTEAVH